MKKYPLHRALLASALLCLGALTGCDKNPVSKLVNPTISGTAGAWSGTWLVYDDEIKTGGGVMPFTTQDGQVLDFNSAESPHSGTRCIKYSWDGRDVTAYAAPPTHPVDYVEHDFTGFSLIVGESSDSYLTTTKDLSAAGYTKISFWVRGSLNSNVYLRLEGANGLYNSPSGTNAWQSNTGDRSVTANWQRYEFSLAGSQATVKDFVRIIFRYDEDGNPETANLGRGNGGTVYIDDIELTR